MRLSTHLDRFLLWVAWGAVGFGLLLLLWGLVNSFDDPEYKLPDALQLKTPSLPASENTFFALYGLDQPTLKDALAHGENAWKLLAEAERARAASSAGVSEAAIKPPPTLHLPNAQTFTCGDSTHCYQIWNDSKQTLQASLATYRSFVDLCYSIAKLAKHEELITPVRDVGVVGIHNKSYPRCSQALLAATYMESLTGDKAAASAKLIATHDWAVNVLKGSHTLIYSMTAVRQLRNVYVLMGELAAEHKELAPAFANAISEAFKSGQLAQQFIPYETAYLNRIISDIPETFCGKQSSSREERLCFPTLGFLKNATIKEMTEAKYELFKRTVELNANELNKLSSERLDASWLSMINFRNPIGHYINTRSSYTDYYVYAARIADVELHRQVLLAALQAIASSVTAEQIAPRLKAHAWDNLAQGRVSVDGAVHRITAKPWQAEFNASVPERDSIWIALPSS
jgi:hypothetical protein